MRLAPALTLAACLVAAMAGTAWVPWTCTIRAYPSGTPGDLLPAWPRPNYSDLSAIQHSWIWSPPAKYTLSSVVTSERRFTLHWPLLAGQVLLPGLAAGVAVALLRARVARRSPA